MEEKKDFQQLEFDFGNYSSEPVGIENADLSEESMRAFGLSLIPLNDVAAILMIETSELNAQLTTEMIKQYEAGKAIAYGKIRDSILKSRHPHVIRIAAEMLPSKEDESHKPVLNIGGELAKMFGITR